MKLIDGWKARVRMSIWNFVWVVPAWKEQQKIESYRFWWTVGKLLNEVITSGVQTLAVKSDQEASIVDVKELSDGRIAQWRSDYRFRGVT